MAREYADLYVYYPLSENRGKVLYDLGNYMTTEVSAFSPYSDVYATSGMSYGWKRTPVGVNRTFLCRPGSMYDYERSVCILGRQKLFHMSYRGPSPFMAAYDTNYYPDAVTVEFWVYPENITHNVFMYSHQSYLSVGFAATSVFQNFVNGFSCTLATPVAKNLWTHFTHVFSRTGTAYSIVQFQLKHCVCA